MLTFTHYVLNLEASMARYIGWAWVWRLEELYTLFAGIVLGMTLAIGIISSTMLKIKERKQLKGLSDSDFSALRVIEKNGKKRIHLNGDTIPEIIDAILSYSLLMFFPGKFTVLKSRTRVKRVLNVLWILSVIGAIIGTILALHVSVDIQGSPPLNKS